MKTVWKTTAWALGAFLAAMALGALFQTPANAATLNGREFTHSIVPVPICDMNKVDEIVSNITRITRVTGENNSQIVLDTINKIMDAQSHFKFKWTQVDFYSTDGTDRSLMFVYAKNPQTGQNCLIYYNDMLTLDEVGEILDELKGV